MLAAAALAVFWTLLAAPAARGAPKVRYVDASGNCGAHSPCYQSIQNAVDAAADSDVIDVAAGFYAEAVVAADKALLFRGPGVGDPQAADDPSSQAVWAQPAGSPAALTLDARKKDVVGPQVTGFRFTSFSAAVRLVGRQPDTGLEAPADLPGSGSTTMVVSADITDNVFHGLTEAPEPAALRAWHTSGTLFSGNRMVDATVQLVGGSHQRLLGNTSVACGGTAFDLVLDGEDIEVDDNIIDKPAGAGIRLTPLVAPGRTGQGQSVLLAGNKITGSLGAAVVASVAAGGGLQGLQLEGGQLEAAGLGAAVEVPGAIALLGGGDRLANVTVSGVAVLGVADGLVGTGAGLYAQEVAGALAVDGCSIVDSAGPGLDLWDAGTVRVTHSQITRNHGGGIRIGETTGQPSDVVVGGSASQANALGGNSGADLALVNRTGSSVSTSDVVATYNDWGTADRSRIEAGIVHRPDDILLGVVAYLPVMAAPETASLAADPASLVADGTSQADVALRAVDLAGEPTADDTLVVFDTDGGSLDRPGAVTQAESLDSAVSGGWEELESGPFGAPDGGYYMHSYVPGSSVTYTFDAAAVLLRYGQYVVHGGVAAVTLDGEALSSIDFGGPEPAWVDRLLARGLGPGRHTLTVTLESGEISLDLFACGTTTTGGTAHALLRSADAVGFGRVSALAFGANGTRQAALAVPFTAGQPERLALELGADWLAAGGATTTITVRASDAEGRPVSDGTELSLSALLGTVDPPSLATAGGLASATYQSPNQSGVDTVRVESGAAFDQKQITVRPGPPSDLHLTASRTSLAANSTSTSDLAVTVNDALGNPAADGTAVVLSTTLGSLEPAGPLATVAGGAHALLRAGAEIGTATVTAVAGPASASQTVRFTATDLRLTKSVVPQTAVVPGEALTFTLSFANVGSGSVYDAVLEDVLPSGLISAVVRTPSGQRVERLLDRPLGFRFPQLAAGDHGDIVVAVRVDTHTAWGSRTEMANRASLGSFLAAELTPADNSDHADILVLPGAVNTVTLTAPASLVVGGATGTVRARLADRFGNPARDGTTVAFSTDLGVVNPALCTTTDGVAEATFTTGPLAGTATVRAVTAEERGATASILVAPGPASQLALVSRDAWLPVGGASTVVTATLADVYGNGVSEPVSFSTDHGLLSRHEVMADATGMATATLRSGVLAETAVIVARSGGLQRQVEVSFRPGAPSAVDLKLDRVRLQVGQSAMAAATVLDDFGNPVPGVTVEFTSTIAAVRDPTSVTDALGVARTTLLARQLGSGVVQATVGNYTAARALVVDLWHAWLPLVMRPAASR